MNLKKIARWFGIGVAALLVFGLTLSSCAMEGQVLEEGTNKPLAGAIVIATWHGSTLNPVHSTSTCFHLETATTDKNGKFKMPSFSGNVDPFIVDRNRYLDVYKAGYQRSAKQAPSETVLLLEPYRGTVTKRLEDIVSVRGNADCGPEKEKSTKLLSLQKALLNEARIIAAAPEDQKLVNSLQHGADRLEFGDEEAYRRLNAGVYGK